MVARDERRYAQTFDDASSLLMGTVRFLSRRGRVSFPKIVLTTFAAEMLGESRGPFPHGMIRKDT